MHHFVVLAFFLFPLTLFAQYTIKDAANESSVPYATVIITGTSIGTVADAEGRFYLSPTPGTDSIRVSAVGYTTARAIALEISGPEDFV